MNQRSGKASPHTRGEAAHRDQREADAGKPKGRVAYDGGEAHARREIAHQQLKQTAEREIGNHQERGARSHDQGVAPERHAEEAVNNHGVDDHHQNEDAEQRRELADERRQRAAAGGAQPSAQAAPRELGADRIAGGDGDNDVEDVRQDRSQQELRVIQRRIGEHIFFDDERAGSERFRGGGRRVRQCRRRRGNGAGKRRRSAVAGREVLPVVENDNSRALAVDQIALEILGDIDRGDRVSGAYRVHRAGHVAGALRDAHAGRRRNRLDIDQRCRRSVGVDDADPEVANDRVAENPSQNGEGDNRHADRQEEREPIAPHPAQFARGDETEAGPRRRLHRRLSGQTA